MQVYMVDMGDNVQYMDKYDMWRYWNNNRDVIQQTYDEWLCDMKRHGLIVQMV